MKDSHCASRVDKIGRTCDELQKELPEMREDGLNVSYIPRQEHHASYKCVDASLATVRV